MRRGINECVERPNIVEWEAKAVGKGVKTSKISCWLCRSPAFVFVFPFQPASEFGFNLRVVLCLVCCPWCPRFQPDLSTPAKKTKKKLRLIFHQVCCCRETRFPNRKTNKCRKTDRYAIHGIGCEVWWGVRRGVIESDRRDDAISSCLFDGSRVVSTMRNKTILVSIPRNKQSCLTKFPLQKHESVVRNQRRTQTKKNSVAQKTKKQKKAKLQGFQ